MYKDITPVEWMFISIANEAGYDKLVWEERIKLGIKEYQKFKDKGEIEEDNYLLIKKLNEVDKVINGENIVPNIYLDATASGLQILSAITLDLVAGSKVNIGTKERKDVYVDTATGIKEQFGLELTRDEIKKPLMTYFYNSRAKIIELLGEEDADIFFTYMEEEGFKGPVKFMKLINDNFEARKDFKWNLPDFKVTTPTEVKIIKDLEYREYTIPFTYYEHKADEDNWRGLVPNIIHSIDAYIVRYVIKKLNEQGIVVHTIHDSFQVSVNNAVALIDAYKEAFIDIIEKELVFSIINDLFGLEFNYDPEKKEQMIEAIKNSEYMLS